MRYALNALAYAVLTAATLHAQNLPGVRRDLPGAQRDLNRRGDGVIRLQRWVDAVQTHRAGVPDDATRQIASWTLEDLEELTIDLPSVLKLMGDPRSDAFNVWIEEGRNAGRRRVVYSGSELDRLRRMARAAGGRDPQAAQAPGDEARIVATQNRLLKRGAAIHTTIALNRPEQTETRLTSGAIARWAGIIRFADGRQVGFDPGANQWEFTRRLLDLITPSPSGDGDVRDWYRAS